MSLGIVFLSEVFGTAMLTLLGCGVVANVALKGTKGNNGGFLMVTWGWGIAVFSGVYVAAMSGAHLNPAVTFGLLLNGKTEYAPGVPVDAASTLTYFGGELLGAFLGAVVMWLAYKQHFDARAGARQPAGRLLHRSGHPLHPVEPDHGDHRHLCPRLRHPDLRRDAFGAWPARRGAARCRHRRLPRWPHRLRHQPGP